MSNAVLTMRFKMRQSNTVLVLANLCVTFPLPFFAYLSDLLSENQEYRLGFMKYSSLWVGA
jgi:hypothetical protein